MYQNYRIRNTSLRPEPHLIFAQVDVPTLFASDMKIVSLKFAGNISMDWESHVKRDDVNKALVLTYPVVIPPKFEIDVELVTRGAGPECSFEVLCCMMPTDIVTVTCHAPPELVISASSLHPNEPTVEFQNVHQTTWRLDGVLPGQGILVRWDPREIENRDMSHISEPQSPVS